MDNNGKVDRTSARKGISRRAFLKQGGAVLGGMVGGGAVATFSPATRSASAQVARDWPGQRYWLNPLLGASGPIQPGKQYNQAFMGIEDAIRIELRSGAEVTPPFSPMRRRSN